MLRLKSKYKKALVTGGSSGLGYEFVNMLLNQGVKVWTTSRSYKKNLKKKNLHYKILDLKDPDSINNFGISIIKEVPDLDLVINNAGSGDFGYFQDFTIQDIENQLQIILKGPIQMSHIFFKLFKIKNKGTLVNVSSLASQFPIPYMSLYNSAKAGLSSFTRSLQLEAINSNITIIDFQPGDYRTDFNKSINVRTNSNKNYNNLNLAKVWNNIEKNLENGPIARHAANNLKHILHKKISSSTITGSLFQAKLVPFLARIASWSIIRFCIAKYYGLK